MLGMQFEGVAQSNRTVKQNKAKFTYMRCNQYFFRGKEPSLDGKRVVTDHYSVHHNCCITLTLNTEMWNMPYKSNI